MRCAVCKANAAQRYRNVDGVGYLRCGACGSLFADPDFLAAEQLSSMPTTTGGMSCMRRGSAASARRCCAWRRRSRIVVCRSARSSISAPAPVGCSMHLRHCCQRRSIGSMRSSSIRRPRRTAPAIRTTSSARWTACDRTFDAGVCIEVIEHLTPTTLRSLVAQLAAVSRPGSLYLFNSGQPDFVEREDPGLSRSARPRPHRLVFAALVPRASSGRPGSMSSRCPAAPGLFLPSSGRCSLVDADALIARLWHPVPENVSMLLGAVRRLIRAAASTPHALPAGVAPRSTGAVSARLTCAAGRLEEHDGVHDHSRWGPTDQIGAGNLLTVEKRLAALQSVRDGPCL